MSAETARSNGAAAVRAEDPRGPSPGTMVWMLAHTQGVCDPAGTARAAGSRCAARPAPAPASWPRTAPPSGCGPPSRPPSRSRPAAQASADSHRSDPPSS